MAPKPAPAVLVVSDPEPEAIGKGKRGSRPKEDTVGLAKHLIGGRDHAGVKHTIDAANLLGLSFTDLSEIHASLHGQGLEHWREG